MDAAVDLFAVFHLNLMFSSIEESQHGRLLTRCYHPLLDLAEGGVPIGVELSGLTAQRIQALDPVWCERFRGLRAQGAVELVGSGYAQLIGPLVPARVNAANLSEGQAVYTQLLGGPATLALTNEMAYAHGLIDSYAEAGVEALIVEWNNAHRFHDWDRAWQSRVARVRSDHAELRVLWADSLFFQQFQRVVHGETDDQEYREFLRRRLPARGYKALYCNDAEVFDYRPGRLATEPSLRKGEWGHIASLLGPMQLMLPSHALRHQADAVDLTIETPEQPVTVKKQRKYNVNRWALSGRADLDINSRCHRLARRLRMGSWSREAARELCYLWSSDFRTHITRARFDAYLTRLSAFEQRLGIRPGALGCEWKAATTEPAARATTTARGFRLHSDSTQLELDTRTGLTIRRFGPPASPLLGLVPHGRFRDIEFGADFYSGHLVTHRPAQRLRTTLDGRHGFTAELDPAAPSVRGTHRFEWGEVRTDVELRDRTLILRRTLQLRRAEPEIIRFFNFTMIPDHWQRESLQYATHNGGWRLERFPLAGHTVDHGRQVSWLTSSEFGLGMTEGLLAIADARRTVTFRACPDGHRVLPKVHYVELDGGEEHFLRLEFSARELDETFVPDDQPLTLAAALCVQWHDAPLDALDLDPQDPQEPT